MRELRLSNGWTQAELAKRAGYSERLIGKAESGLPIARDTIADIADALSESAQSRVYWEDLACDPVQLAWKYLEALHDYQADAIDYMRPFLAEDVVVIVAGDPEKFPFAGKHVGIEEVDRIYKVFFSIMEAPQTPAYQDCYQVIAQGANAVIWGESWIHPIGHPIKTPVRFNKKLTFRRGKLIQIEDCFDTATGLDCMRGELSESPGPQGEVN
ncbi:helix-turn-helix domain-containing protein [Bremerella sp. JC770]|uniref:helix-turn-helix domain-containing protein n=1 Tax=Bremerella sp. JC770 TaxID=3232137 RepID=UPI003457F9E8